MPGAPEHRRRIGEANTRAVLAWLLAHPGGTNRECAEAVGLTFNPSGDDAVAQCKQGFASLIDQMNDLRTGLIAGGAGGGAVRLASVAITEMQTAQMWAVKALTWRD